MALNWRRTLPAVRGDEGSELGPTLAQSLADMAQAGAVSLAQEVLRLAEAVPLTGSYFAGLLSKPERIEAPISTIFAV